MRSSFQLFPWELGFKFNRFNFCLLRKCKFIQVKEGPSLPRSIEDLQELGMEAYLDEKSG